MKTYHSKGATEAITVIRCQRCRQTISYQNSAFVAVLEKHSATTVKHDIVKASTLTPDTVAVHLNGDRDCGREVSGFKGNLLKTLGLSEGVNLDFLDGI